MAPPKPLVNLVRSAPWILSPWLLADPGFPRQGANPWGFWSRGRDICHCYPFPTKHIKTFLNFIIFGEVLPNYALTPCLSVDNLGWDRRLGNVHNVRVTASLLLGYPICNTEQLRVPFAFHPSLWNVTITTCVFLKVEYWFLKTTSEGYGSPSLKKYFTSTFKMCKDLSTDVVWRTDFLTCAETWFLSHPALATFDVCGLGTAKRMRLVFHNFHKRQQQFTVENTCFLWSFSEINCVESRICWKFL